MSVNDKSRLQNKPQCNFYSTGIVMQTKQIIRYAHEYNILYIFYIVYAQQ